jgi:hypothetical protein
VLPVLLAAHTGLWNVLGGHVTLGAILALVIAMTAYQAGKRLLFCILLYYGLALAFWMIGDLIFGPYHLGAVHEFPTF